MEDFRLRTVTEVSDKFDEVRIAVTRTRTSKGFCSIKLTVGVISIDFSTDVFGHSYEQIAREAALLLDEISNNPCSIEK